MYILIYDFRNTRRTTKPIAAVSFAQAREAGKTYIPKRAVIAAVRKTA